MILYKAQTCHLNIAAIHMKSPLTDAILLLESLFINRGSCKIIFLRLVSEIGDDSFFFLELKSPLVLIKKRKFQSFSKFKTLESYRSDGLLLVNQILNNFHKKV